MIIPIPNQSMLFHFKFPSSFLNSNSVVRGYVHIVLYDIGFVNNGFEFCRPILDFNFIVQIAYKNFNFNFVARICV